MSSGIIVKSTYGYDIISSDDEYIKLAIRTAEELTSLGVPGLTVVDMFPLRTSSLPNNYIPYIQNVLSSLVRHMPDWVPGPWLIGRAKHVRALLDQMMTEPYERVKSEKVCRNSLVHHRVLTMKAEGGPQ